MRKVVLGMNVSLDGYVAGPRGELDWFFPNINDELNQFILGQLRQIDTFLMGRVTYEGMAATWPTSRDEAAPLMNNADKVVFSHTLNTVEWAHSRLATRAAAEEIAHLKQQPGKIIGVAGGAQFAQTLSRQGLINEYTLIIHPVVLGSGKPLFQDLARPVHLKLLETKSLQTGVVVLHYETERA